MSSRPADELDALTDAARGLDKRAIARLVTRFEEGAGVPVSRAKRAAAGR